jgi:glycosyltransferase involved in cell wall biosynthesis
VRVLQVRGGLAGGSAGGAERCCVELSRWLTESGFDVLTCAPPDPGSPESPASLRQSRWKPLRKLVFDFVSPANAGRLRHLIDEFQPDVVHFHSIYGLGSQLVRVASARAPTLVTVHDYWPVDVFVPRVSRGQLRYPRRQRLVLPWVWTHRILHRRNLRGATLVSPSRYLARRLASFGYRDVRIIPNGVTLPKETTAGANSILFVGRLVAEKGLQEALGPVARIAAESSWQIDVVGDGPLRTSLERTFPSVRFHGRVEPAPYYRRARVLIVPSRWPENTPYVVLEAMSHGVAVLAASVGGIPEIVEDGVTGRLYETDDGEQFVRALNELVADTALCARLGREARERIAREFTWASIGPRYVALYEEVSRVRALQNSKAVVRAS